MKTQRRMNAPQLYEIRVASHLSVNWTARFEGMSLRREPEGETVLSGMLDQAALHGVFMIIRSLGLNLISVKCVEATKSSHSGAGNERSQKNGGVKNE